MHSARLIIDPPAEGPWNMAVDEALLRTAAPQNRITLRVYRWQEPTLSLGYFQRYAHRQQHAPSRTCPVVRRTTGGGAIVHDQEVTYSLVMPVHNRMSRDIADWYRLIHGAWIETLAQQGIQTHLCNRPDPSREDRFLCFERRTMNDLLLDNWKIGGSAQRRHRNAVLQHGSLLMSRSSAAPELPGVQQLAPDRFADDRWLHDWIELVGRKLSLRWVPSNLDRRETALAVQLVDTKFGAAKWTLKR